jgi:hypothetical protein
LCVSKNLNSGWGPQVEDHWSRHEARWDCWKSCLNQVNSGSYTLDMVNILFYVTESEEESVPKKPVTPVNGKVAKKPPAE